MRTWPRLALISLACFLAGAALALLLFVTWLHAPASHTESGIRYLVISGIVSLGAGVLTTLIATRLAPTLALKIAAAFIAGSVIAIGNIVVTPLLMFKEHSDFTILIITLVYFGALSLAFAAIVGVLTTQQIHALHSAAERLAAGELGAQAEVRGLDEVAGLTRTFNRLSADLRESAERQEAMERERRDLVASVSHDLRTPLASMRAMIEAINDRVVTEPETVQRYLHRVQGEIEHLGGLIDDLFEVARIDSGNLELRLATIPLPELVDETVQGLQARADEKGVHLRAVCEPGVPPATLDGPRMQRVLLNLIENAVRHTPSGGTVEVRVERLNGHIRLSVQDTGEGIAEEDRPRVFDRFYRGEKSRSRESGGAGLGLAIARGIVEAHGGSINVESRPGEGTRFELELPG